MDCFLSNIQWTSPPFCVALYSLLLLPIRLPDRVPYFVTPFRDVRDFSSPADIFQGVNIELSVVLVEEVFCSSFDTCNIANPRQIVNLFLL